MSNGTTTLQVGMPSCGGCYAGRAAPGDAVFRVLGEGNLLFNITGTASDTRKIIFANDYDKLMQVNADGKIVIGTNLIDNNNQPGDYKLFVQSGILTEKLKVSLKTSSDWADYVFADDYKLMTFAELEKYIASNKHLPNVPSADQVQKEGIDVAKMDAKLLEKIEELALYLIQLNKRIGTLEQENKALKGENR